MFSGRNPRKASVGTPTQTNAYQDESFLLSQLPPNLHQASHPHLHLTSLSPLDRSVSPVQTSSLIHWKSHPQFDEDWA